MHVRTAPPTTNSKSRIAYLPRIFERQRVFRNAKLSVESAFGAADAWMERSIGTAVILRGSHKRKRLFRYAE
jgi:hypothetical protein